MSVDRSLPVALLVLMVSLGASAQEKKDDGKAAKQAVVYRPGVLWTGT